MTDEQQKRKEWLARRKNGIGASEAAAVLGMSPWGSPVEVWARKMNLMPEMEDTVRLMLGRKFEAAVAETFALMEGVQIEGDGMTSVFHPTLPIFCTPDRFILGPNGKPARGLEVKTVEPMMAHEWGEEGTDHVPRHYLIQCVVSMGVCDLPRWDLAAFFSMNDLRRYRIYRDEELERNIFEQLDAWWTRHVVGNVEPELDGTESCGEYLKVKFPKNMREMVAADEATERLIADLLALRDNIGIMEMRKEETKNRIKAFIGDADGVQGSCGRVTWKMSKDRKEVDWEAAITDFVLAAHGENPPPEIRTILGEVIKRRTRKKAGSRRFLPTKAPV